MVNNNLTKICQFCGCEININAQKCQYCGEWLTNENTGLSCGLGFSNPVVQFLMIFTLITVILLVFLAVYGNGNIIVAIILGILFAGIGGYIYLLPSIIAASRNHPQILPIILVNIFCGETVIGWVGAMIWATTHRHGRNTHW